MRLLRTRLIVSIVVASGAVCCGQRSDVATKDRQPESSADSETAFALSLYSGCKSQPGNLFFSPYSAATCLRMAYAGARGGTQKEFAKVLCLSLPESRSRLAFAELRHQLDETRQQPGIELNIANGVWAQSGRDFLPTFIEICTHEYSANLSQVDFEDGRAAAAQAINSWVAQKTKDKIQNLIDDRTISPLTRLVLVNAIYLKARWAVPFWPGMTKDEPFKLEDGRQRTVPMMVKEGSFNHAGDALCEALELEYAGGQLSMVILLPREVDGLGRLESKLDSRWLAHLLGGMERTNAKTMLHLPRFKIQWRSDIVPVLRRMGMREAFVEGLADFSGMDGTRRLFVSAVQHAAWVDVNEDGTESAATFLMMAAEGIADSTFRADHPFLFLIRDKPTGALLFIGRLVDPGTEAEAAKL